MFRGKPHYPVRGKFRYPPQPPFPLASPIPPPPRTPSRISCRKWRIYAVSGASAGRKTVLNSQAEISKFKADSMSLQDSRFCPFEDNGYCPETSLLIISYFGYIKHYSFSIFPNNINLICIFIIHQYFNYVSISPKRKHYFLIIYLTYHQLNFVFHLKYKMIYQVYVFHSQLVSAFSLVFLV